MCGGMNPGSCVGIDAGTFLMAAETPPSPRPAASKWSWPESVGELPLRWPRMPCSIGRGRDVPKCGMDDASLSRRLRRMEDGVLGELVGRRVGWVGTWIGRAFEGSPLSVV